MILLVDELSTFEFSASTDVGVVGGEDGQTEELLLLLVTDWLLLCRFLLASGTFSLSSRLWDLCFSVIQLKNSTSYHCICTDSALASILESSYHVPLPAEHNGVLIVTAERRQLQFRKKTLNSKSLQSIILFSSHIGTIPFRFYG